MKRTKWATYKFNPAQRQARLLAREALARRVALGDALHMVDLDKNRAKLHQRLDTVIDGIESMEERARAMFPEVEESFTVATETVRL